MLKDRSCEMRDASLQLLDSHRTATRMEDRTVERRSGVSYIGSLFLLTRQKMGKRGWGGKILLVKKIPRNAVCIS